MRKYKIAQISGDGIGPEVINAGVEVLVALSKKSGDFDLDIVRFPWGTDYYLKPVSYTHLTLPTRDLV